VLLDVLTRVGPETVERFAYEWYGPPRAVASAAEEPGDVPEPLRRFYDIAGRWPTLVVQNSLVRPPESWLHRDRLSDGLGPLRRLPFASWRGFPEGATFYASDDLLAVSCLNPSPESHEYLSVWVGAHDQSALSALDSVMDESWEHDSRRV
jgi:hypothetical protein